MRRVLGKCKIESVRPARDEEWIGSDVIRVLSADAKASLERRGKRGYVDATNEEGPTEDDLRSPDVVDDPLNPPDNVNPREHLEETEDYPPYLRTRP